MAFVSLRCLCEVLRSCFLLLRRHLELPGVIQSSSGLIPDSRGRLQAPGPDSKLLRCPSKLLRCHSKLPAKAEKLPAETQKVPAEVESLTAEIHKFPADLESLTGETKTSR